MQTLLQSSFLDESINLVGHVFLNNENEKQFIVTVKFEVNDSFLHKIPIDDSVENNFFLEIVNIFNFQSLKNVYNSLLRSYDKSTVIEKEHEFLLTFDKSQKLASISSINNPTLDVLFMGGVATSGMRDYQLEGINWLINNNVAVLADDMGLGKTVQAIKAMDIHFRSGEITKCIIVSPISLIKNWENEISKWSPHLVYNRFSSKTSDTEVIKLLAVSHILITNYENLRNENIFLKDYNFDLMILDEAHRIRKFSSQVSKAVFDFKKEKLWALTGTPIENNIQDFLTLVGHLTGNKISNSEKNRSTLYLQEQLKPFALRRLKSQVLKELPPVTEIDLPVELMEQQRELYDKVWDTRQDIINKQGSYFSVLSKLREICDGDNDYSKNTKAKVIGDLIKNIQDNNEKVIVFSYYLKPLRAVSDYLNYLNIDYVKFYEIDSIARESAIEQFKKDNSKVAFLASSRIASEGLTLTEANNVIFINRWWNPSSNNQARDRVIRIGQQKKVFIYNVYCANTVEERVTEILKEKSSLYKNVVDGLVDNLELISKELLL